jgi:hypothetical protein
VEVKPRGFHLVDVLSEKSHTNERSKTMTKLEDPMLKFKEAQEADEAAQFGETPGVEAVEHEGGPEHVEVDTTDYTAPMIGTQEPPAYDPPASGLAQFQPSNPAAQHTPTAAQAAEHAEDFAQDRQEHES